MPSLLQGLRECVVRIFVSIIPCDSVSQAIAHLTDTPAEMSLAQAKSRNTGSTHSGTERNKLHRNLGNVCRWERDAAEEERWLGGDGQLGLDCYRSGTQRRRTLHALAYLFPHYPFPLSTVASTSLIRTSSRTNDTREGQLTKAYICQSIFFLKKLSLI